MTKNSPKSGNSARRGNSPAPYTRKGRVPYKYPWERRTGQGDLMSKANDRPANKYP